MPGFLIMPAVARFESGLLSGLTNYFGGKRKIVKLIARLAVGRRFCDLFFGGGSVGLYMKAQGFEVEACDRSFLSYLVGKALLANDFKKVSRPDLQRMFLPQDANHFCTDNYFPNLFTDRHSQWIDDAVHAAEKVHDETSRSLLKLVIAKAIFHLRAFGAFTNQLYMKQWNGKDETGILKRSGSYFKNLAMTTWELAGKSAGEVNASVFPNGQVNRFFPCDVFEYLALNNPLDTIYLDPPYYGSQNYEAYYAIVNKILTGGRWSCPPVSHFNNAENYFNSIREIVSACERIPRMIFSYGGYKGAGERDRITEAIAAIRGPAVQMIEVPYQYSIHRTGGNGDNAPEFLIVSDL